MALVAVGAGLALLVSGLAVYAQRAEDVQELAPTPDWRQIERVGEESAWVEIVEEGGDWVMVGDRAIGVRVHDAPPYQVPVRKWEDIPKFPCSDCHKDMEIDYTRRVLVEDHEDLEMDHANQRLWCTDCHDGKGLDLLESRNGMLIDMDLGYLQCAECHFGEFRDWEFGAHGKRIGLWNGVRVLRTCTECHDAHTPQIPLEEPVGPPQVRENLQQFVNAAPAPKKMWERLAPGQENE